MKAQTKEDFKKKLIDNCHYYEDKCIKIRERRAEINSEISVCNKLGFKDQVFFLIKEREQTDSYYYDMSDLIGYIKKFIDSEKLKTIRLTNSFNTHK